MNLIWRFLWVILFSRFGTKTNFFTEGRTVFHVLPTDVDVLLHMNNGRYFSLMDVARINFMIRNKAFPILRKNRVYPVIAAEMIRFKKSLELFQRFEITTKILGWDDKFFYVLHRFESKKTLYAQSVIKARFLRQGDGTIDPDKVLELIGQKTASPPLPKWLTQWQQAEQEFYAKRADF